MAEFLIFIRNTSVLADSGHWYDQDDAYTLLQLAIEAKAELTASEITEQKDKLALKYAARSQPGDIVEAHDTGYYCEPHEKTGRGWNHRAFALLRVPDIQLADARRYTGPLMSADGTYAVRKFRYSVASLGLAAGEAIERKWTDVEKQLVDKNG